MSKYNLDLDYLIPMIDISKDELKEIIAEADIIIMENNENHALSNSEELAVAYLKKAQSMQKLVEAAELETEDIDKINITATDDGAQNTIKKLLEKVLELSPDKPEALMQMGKVLFRTPEENYGHIEKARDMYSRAIELKPNYPAAYNNRGTTYTYSSSDHSNFINKMKDIPDEFENATFSGSFTICIPDKDEIRKGIADYTEAIRLRSHDPVYYYNRGNCYLKLEEHEKAIEDYTNAINFSSTEFKKVTKLFHIRGLEFMRIKEYEKAICDFTESINLGPDYIDTLFLRAKCYLFIGEHDKAKADLAEFRRLKIEKTTNL